MHYQSTSKFKANQINPANTNRKSRAIPIHPFRHLNYSHGLGNACEATQHVLLLHIMYVFWNRISCRSIGKIEQPCQLLLCFLNIAIYHFFFTLQYNIKKKEELVEAQPQEEPNPLMRKKKTPEELAAEAEQEDLDDFTSKCELCFFYFII